MRILNEEVKRNRKFHEADDKYACKAFVASVEDYTQGRWVTFPMKEEVFREVLDDAGILSSVDGNRYVFADFDGVWAKAGLDVESTYDELEALAEAMEDFHGTMRVLFMWYFDNYCHNDYSEIKEAKEYTENAFVIDGDDDYTSLAEGYLREIGGISFDTLGYDTISENFDYEKYGEDIADDFEYVEDTGWVSQANAEGLVLDVDNDYASLGEACINDLGGIETLSEDTLEKYFDYEYYGRNLSYDFDYVEGVGWVYRK